MNYIKLYGSISKYNGSYNNELTDVLLYINKNDIFLNINKPDNYYINFNNLETDLNNNRYSSLKKSNKTSNVEEVNDDLDIVSQPKDQSLDQSLDQSEAQSEEQLKEQSKEQSEEQLKEQSEEQSEAQSVEDQSEVQSVEAQSVEEQLEAQSVEEQSEDQIEDTEDLLESKKDTVDEEQSKGESKGGTNNSDIDETLTNSEDDLYEENINIPASVFDAKCLYKIIEKLNKN